jgi:signal transduction histidine kinase
VHVRWADDELVLRIRDDGRGFEPAAIPAGHFGIGFMRERAAAIAATLDIASRPGAGTTVTIDWRGR